MFRFKFFISILSFSLLLIGTSIIKNQTREIEKKISILGKVNFNLEKNIHETQLDFSYLTSPSLLEKRIEHLDINQYLPMEHSKIFLKLSNFIDLNNKYAIQENLNEKRIQKK